MKRYLFEFDPEIDGTGDLPAGDLPADDVTPDDAPVDDAPVTGDELADADAALQPDYGSMWSDPNFQAGMAGFLQQFAGGQPAPPPDQGGFQQAVPDLPELDPYDPDSLQQYLEARDARNNAMHAQAFAQAISSVIGPYQGTLEKQAVEGWKQETDAYYGQVEKQYGSFDHDLARSLAAGVDALGEVQYGQNAHDIAARKLSEYVKAQRTEAVEQYKQSLRRDDSTPFEPPIRGAGVHGDNDPVDELEAARRWAGRKTAPAV